MRYARAFFVVVILLCVLETVRLWFLTPDVMAAHFDVQGNPDRFVSKLAFFGFQTQTVLPVILLSIALQILPLILPVQWINMPNREYWFAPERRKDTLDRLSSFGAAMFAIILLVIQAGFELSISANLHEPIVFAAPIMISIMAASFISIFVLLFWFAMSFRLPA